MSKSKYLLYLSLSFIIGIGIVSFLAMPIFLIYFFLALAVLFLIVFWKNKKMRIIGFCLLVLFLAFFRYQTALPKINEEKISFYLGEYITWQGQIISQPDERTDNTQLVVAVNKLIYDNQEKQVSGKVLVMTRIYPQYNYGDKLEISGKLNKPEKFEESNFDWPGYLAKDDIYAISWYPKIEAVGQAGNPFSKAIFALKERFNRIINRNLSQPQSSLLSAMLLGLKKSIPQEFKEALSRTGTSHITAVSGLHITVVSQLLMSFALAVLALRRKQAFYFATIAIIFYILLVGAPASAVRAGIMGFLLLWARYLGRLRSSTSALLLAGLLMLLINPMLLRYDIGFQFSFLAMLGLIYLGPIFYQWFRRIPKDFQVRPVLAMTLSAQVFVFPLILYYFGQFSSAAPLANLLVVPVLPVVMTLGFLLLLPALIWPFLGQILVWPVWLFLTWIAGVVIFLDIPYLTSHLGVLHWAWLIPMYLTIILLTIKLRNKSLSNQIWEEN